MVFWLFRKKRDDSEIKNIHSIMENSFSNIKMDMKSISTWIDHFKNKHETHDNSFDKVVKDIEMIKKMFEQHMQYHHFERSIGRSIAIERVQSFKRSDQSFMNVQDLGKINKNKEDKDSNLTPSQKRVLGLLNRSSIPLDYKTMANELKLNIVTVRRYINDIKKVFDINEMMNIDSGRKVFYIGKEAKMSLKHKK